MQYQELRISSTLLYAGLYMSSFETYDADVQSNETLSECNHSSSEVERRITFVDQARLNSDFKRNSSQN